MRILAIDTSSSVLSLGYMRSGKVLGELMQDKALTHSEKLMPHIAYFLESMEEKISDVDVFAVTVGPGSFTGLRIGVATANAFAMAGNKKVIGISTLEALAYPFRYLKCPIISTIHAQREDYYTELYTSLDLYNVQKTGSTEILDKEALLERAHTLSQTGEVMIVGDLASALREKLNPLPEILKKNADPAIIHLAPTVDNYIRGSLLCEMAKNKKELYDFVEPVYIRKSQAEVQYEEKRRKRTEAIDHG